ncbi:MAG: hypothetical protein HZA67_03660 [Rhodospirillales bacterium]|nr:hypothetical protein [Rhodospirillales bacterium]
MKHTFITTAILSAVFAGGTALAADPAKIDWSKVPVKEITLFYPGQSTQEWMKSAAHKAGATGVNAGKSCNECHAGEEKDLGDVIVSGKKLEPTPISGKPGSIKLKVQAAYDKENFYLRANWPTNLKEAGAFHNYKGLKDGKWVTYGSNRTDKDVKSGAAKVSYEDRFNFMFADSKGTVANFANQGCWVTCHNSMRDAPNEPTKDQVKAHPVLGDAGMKKDDIRKYLSETRTEMNDAGGWDKLKSKEDLDALMAKGTYLDLWQARAYRSVPVGKADDSYVFQWRNFDKGKKPFDGNWDGAKKEPKFMFDPAKNGGKAALSEAQFRDLKAPKLTTDNSIPYDASKMKDGDILPGFILNPATDGSASDLNASGTWANGEWTMIVSRKLDTGQKDDVALAPGQTYPVGLAVHDDNVTTRFHYVSLPKTLSLGAGKGDINAVELK